MARNARKSRQSGSTSTGKTPKRGIKMNEILNQKFGVEVEMYDITRAQAAVVVKKTLEACSHETYAIEGKGEQLDERTIRHAL